MTSSNVSPGRVVSKRPARDVRPGMKVRGHQTLDVYDVLDVGEEGHVVVLTVLNATTGNVRHWRRRPDFRMRMA